MPYCPSYLVIVAVHREKFRSTSRGKHLTARVTTQTYASFDVNDLLQNDHPLDEYVVFVTPTALQLAIFSRILHPDKLDDLVQSSTAESLALINMLTKVSNSPILLKATADKAKLNSGQNFRHATISDALKLLPEGAQIDDVSLSGKLTLSLATAFQDCLCFNREINCASKTTSSHPLCEVLQVPLFKITHTSFADH